MAISEDTHNYWMNNIQIKDEYFLIELPDGMTIRTPFARFARLRDASPEQRLNFRLIGNGEGIHWPDIDEDISIKGLIREYINDVRNSEN